MRTRSAWVYGLAAIAAGAAWPAWSAPVISASDLWNGPAAVSYTLGTPIFPASEMFDGAGGSDGVNNAILANGFGPGTVHTVSWTTAAPVTVRSLNLFLSHDRGVPIGTSFKSRDARARGISRFELFAHDGVSYVSVFTADVTFQDGGATTGTQPTGIPDCRLATTGGCLGGFADPIYAGAVLSGPGETFTNGRGGLVIAGDLAPTTASQWRAAFTQVGNYLDGYNDTGGPRILELDGLAGFQYVPLPAPFVLLGSALLGVGWLRRRRV
jgi:hypothetical protein